MVNVDKRIQEMLSSTTQGSNLKDGIETANASVLKSRNKSASAQSIFEPASLSISNGELDQSFHGKKKDTNSERPNLNASAGKVPMQNARNLKDMVTTGLTAKKEKDERVQQMKKDVAELIRMRVPYIKSKVLKQQAGESGDFQEMGNEEKEMVKRKYAMDDPIEDKICDLHDLHGVDEDTGPQARKLYCELAHLWPEGFMDNHGIKRAICRAKDRKRTLYGRSKDQEKIKRKKLVPKTEGTVRADINSVAQPQHAQEKSVSEPNHSGLSTSSKSVPSTTSSNARVGVVRSTQGLTNPDRSKQDKMKEKAKGSSINLNEKVPIDVLVKKKVKRKPDTEPVGGQIRLEKPVSSSGDEKSKSHH